MIIYEEGVEEVQSHRHLHHYPLHRSRYCWQQAPLPYEEAVVGTNQSHPSHLRCQQFLPPPQLPVAVAEAIVVTAVSDDSRDDDDGGGACCYRCC